MTAETYCSASSLVTTPSATSRVRVQRPHGRLSQNPLDHQRLRVRRIVLLVVAESPVPDEIDDEVVPELGPVGERQPHCRDGRLGIVGVDVHDRDVEALREIARVPSRPALGRVRRIPDLVVGDQMQRPAGRIALERLEIQRLGDDALPGEGCVTVDENRKRDRRIVDTRTGRSVRLLGSRPALDDGVRSLEVTRVRHDDDVDLSELGQAGTRRGEMVLHVAGATLGIDHECIRRALPFELAEDLLIGATDGVHESVQPPSVGHADHDLVRSTGRRERNRSVEHRDERLEPLERELLLAEKRPAQILLEALGLGEAAEKRTLFLRVERLPEPAGLDRLAEPDAFCVIRDVLDLVGHRTGVHVPKSGKCLEKRLSVDIKTEE